MCGRTIAGDMSWTELYEAQRAFLDEMNPDLPPIRESYNVAPTSICPIIVKTDHGKSGLMARWGLVPHWYKKPLKEWKATTFNARSEEAHEKPVFRDALKTHRCIVPVKGYYEWSDKQPYRVNVQTNLPAFCLAGIYSHVKLPDFEGYTFSILTEASYPPLKTLHHRVPVILSEESHNVWLCGKTDLAEIKRIDPSRIHFHRVTSEVGNVRNDSPDLILPVAVGS